MAHKRPDTTSRWETLFTRRWFMAVVCFLLIAQLLLVLPNFSTWRHGIAGLTDLAPPLEHLLVWPHQRHARLNVYETDGGFRFVASREDAIENRLDQDYLGLLIYSVNEHWHGWMATTRSTWVREVEFVGNWPVTAEQGARIIESCAEYIASLGLDDNARAVVPGGAASETRIQWRGYLYNLNLLFLATLLGAALTLHGRHAWRRVRAVRRLRAGSCPDCGYLLRAGQLRRCPECGWRSVSHDRA